VYRWRTPPPTSPAALAAALKPRGLAHQFFDRLIDAVGDLDEVAVRDDGRVLVRRRVEEALRRDPLLTDQLAALAVRMRPHGR
jgi:hypothetical protein